jgi:uroporphyrinogen decarboxylase
VDSRERISRILNKEKPDRVGYEDADIFADTVARWHSEGLPAFASTIGVAENPWLNVNSLRHFGMDIYTMWADISPKYDVVEYEIGEDWVVIRDELGSTKKRWTSKSAPPLYLEPIVQTPEDFREKVEPLLDSDDMRRVSSSHYPFRDRLEKAVRLFQKEFFVVVGIPGPFFYCTFLCGGLSPTLVMMMKNKQFMDYMLNSIAEFLTSVSESYRDAGVDGLWLFDDLGTKDGLFFSPELFVELLKRPYEKICTPFRKKGLPNILHSDGYIESIIPHLIETGFAALQPLQNGIGMDVKMLKEKYGDQITLMGGIDTRVLSSGDVDAIKNEVKSKISVAGNGGGYIATSDGPIPPTVSLKSYNVFVEALKQYGRYPIKT